ncbi:GGDEF domain-containing protein [Shewanella pealeana]|uniref:diguanylate cyclase n=1 Tax=Shewanella pealeana (strain ATCC 700345 / ANG-SQ1) TaxID=398579 RepID=A8GZ56_SHEPA|nr:GGDEF domain-containing protein [Shewanella pealeana]ABV85593.1 diguanylate cyclase [Shewanella pealeana ATCC 700345]
MLESKVSENSWLLVKYSQAMIRPLSAVGIIFGCAAMFGYLGAMEWIYRPVTNGPATNPLTAMCMIFIGTALWISKKKSDANLALLLLSAVIIITLTLIFDVISGSNFSAILTPFQEQVALELKNGKSNSMGINSSVMFLFIAISLVLFVGQKLIASQLFAFIALAIPTVSFTGYAYGLEQFYGQMSMLTAFIGFVLAIAALMMTAKVGGVNAILSPFIGGKIARRQTAAGYFVPAILGYLLIKSLCAIDGELCGIFVVTICWFVILMISYSALFQEKMDLERRQMEQLLTLAAMNDQLTGLANRRKFHEFAQEELNRVQRNKSQFWVLVMDVDFFKKINDTAGHDMGDQVLIELSKVLKNSVRAVDLVSRMGGEEFSIILSDTTKQGAERVAESIRSSIESIKIKGWTDIYGPITASIGGATSDGADKLENTLKIADSALYQAKQRGRNQVYFAAE